MRRIERNQLYENLKGNGVSDEEYHMAYKRVKRIKGFYVHLMVYVLVNIAIIFNHYFEQENYNALLHWQTYITAFFWGIGLVAHGFSVFASELFFGDNWEEKKIREFMNKEK
jgi:hypothetical protein